MGFEGGNKTTIAQRSDADHCRTLNISGNCIKSVSVAQVNSTIVYAKLEMDNGNVGVIGTNLNKEKITSQTKLDLCLTGFAGTLDDRKSGKVAISSLAFYEGATKKTAPVKNNNNLAGAATPESNSTLTIGLSIGALAVTIILGCVAFCCYQNPGTKSDEQVAPLKNEKSIS